MRKSENNVPFGFRVIQEEALPELGAQGTVFMHEKSGARLLYVKNQDKNKVFFAAFKTPPENDCGTPHILEHSVLCGSKKYGAKDPFNELAKGSLHTYLNAMTYSDKTMYPVASTNEQDFSHLVDVYLDAVFCPKIYEKEEIFMQEGWHHALADPGAPLQISGVVYNEMKGALSDPEQILEGLIAKSLFPDSIYRFESGGDPEAIPNLCYQDFLSFHQKYYHPANCYFYFYGDVPIAPYLQKLDEEYLSHFHKEGQEEVLISHQAPFTAPVICKDTYPVVQEDLRDTYFSYSTVVQDCRSPKMALAFDILTYLLLSTNASPLKKALIDAGICEDVAGWFDSSTLDMVWSVVAKKAEEGKQEEFQEVVRETLSQIVRNGFDKKLIEATLHVWEFHLREEDFGYRPKGLVYGTRVMKSWLHGGDPMAYLNLWAYFEEIKKALQEPYFERLIDKYLLNNPHASYVFLKGEAGKQAKTEEAQKKRLAEYKASLDQDAVLKLVSGTRHLEEYQKEAESPEVLLQIPVLALSDVSKKIELHQTRREKFGGAPALVTHMASHGVSYLHLLFRMDFLPQALLPYAGLLAKLLTRVGTEKYGFLELPVMTNRYTGGISADCNAVSQKAGGEMAYLCVRAKYLNQDAEKAFDLIEEMLLHTVFQKEFVKNCLKELIAKKEDYLMNDSHSAAVLRVSGGLFLADQIREEVRGIRFYKFLTALAQDFDGRFLEISEKLRQAAGCLFQRETLFVGFSGDEAGEAASCKEVSRLYQSLGVEALQKQRFSFAPSSAREAFGSASKVNYVAKAADFGRLGYSYSGKMQVLKGILNQEYLWNQVRVMGGAYGCGSGLQRNGKFYFYSYRDPHIKRTLSAFDACGAFLEELALSERGLRKFILGAINELDRPQTNGDTAELVLMRYLSGITDDDRQQERDEVLSTKCADIQKYGALVAGAMAQNHICVVGNDGTIRENNLLFEEISPFLG